MVLDFLTSDLGAALITGVIALAGYLGRRFVLGLIRWKRGREALERLGQHASRAVLATYQEFVEECRAASADGKLTAAEKDLAKKMALDKLKTYCGWDDLAWILGLEKAEAAASDAVESALVQAKAVGLLPPSARASPPSKDASQEQDGSTSASA